MTNQANQAELPQSDMRRRLDNKIALVTGATSGIGRAAAVVFAQAGASLVLTGRNEAEGAETVRLVHEQGGRCIFVRADISKRAEVESMVAEAVAHYGRLDVAFNNAGRGHGAVLQADEDDAGFDQLFNTNVRGTWYCMKYEIQQFIKQGGGGAIVNISSLTAHVSAPGLSFYGASKCAVEGLTRGAALDYAPQRIRVNAIAPGIVRTNLLSHYKPEQLRQMEQSRPLGRMAEPWEIAEAGVYLLSDAAAYVTGIILPVEGGHLLR